MSDAIDPRLLPPELDLADGDIVEVDSSEEPEGREPGFDGTDDAGSGAAPSAEERRSGFDGVGTRREARERALGLLYEAEQKDIVPPAEVLDHLPIPVEPFAGQLVAGVSDHLAELDEVIGRFAVGWTVVRMPAIDRTLLRLATYELAHTDVPVGACISEAVELAKRYSTDESPGFVNGLLSRLARELRPEG